MLDLHYYQTQNMFLSYQKYEREQGKHKASFEALRKIFLQQKSEIPNYKDKTGKEVGDDFTYFTQDYYFELNAQQQAKAPLKYELNAQQSSELKPQIEQKELVFELNAQQTAQQNNEQICTTCGNKFGTIQALNGHKRTCKTN